MILCPYCKQAEIGERSSARIWTDFIAKMLAQGRIYFELKSDPEFGIRKLLKAFVDPDSMPLPTSNDRKCPFCGRGRVTRRAMDSIWPDLVARMLGLVRQYVEIRGDHDGIPFRDLAIVIVEGDDTEHFYAHQTDQEEFEEDDDDDYVEPESVETTPFDDDIEEKVTETDFHGGGF
jgi:ribosomal protein L37AE/L43A